MKTLSIIQTLSKIGRILSKIIFICCIVGFCVCAVNLFVCLGSGGEAFKLGGVTFRSMIENRAGMNLSTVAAYFTVGAVFCAVDAVLCRYAEIYFQNELADGTPFTMRGAKELMRLGILTVAVSVGAVIVCSIGVAAARHFAPGIDEISPDAYSAAGIGVVMIVLSLFCRCGAELIEERTNRQADETVMPTAPFDSDAE